MNEICDVLVFAAHPDDIEFTMSGTVIKLSRAGYKVELVVLTKSEMSTFGTVDNRQKEAQAAAKIMGANLTFLDFADTGIENDRPSRISLARIIRERKPQIVFAPYHSNPHGSSGGVAHVDHYTTGQLVRDAVKFARLEKTVPELPKHELHKLYFYMIPSDIRPNIMVDVSDVIEELERSIECYQSQLAISRRQNSIQEILRVKRAAAGIDIGVKYAEGFLTDQAQVYSVENFFSI